MILDLIPVFSSEILDLIPALFTNGYYGKKTRCILARI